MRSAHRSAFQGQRQNVYETFYGLKARPFTLAPDSRFFFGSTCHKRALSYLQYGVEQGEGFIIITGDIGTGKSTLVQTLFDSLDREGILALQIVTSQLEASDLLRMVAASCGLDYEGVSKANLLKRIEGFLTDRAWDGKRVLLVVDEAQNMPFESLEELRMLSNFQVAGVSLIQIFLLGQKEFHEILRGENMEQLRQRVIGSCHLKPLERPEMEQYILHRLGTAGWRDDPAFEPEAFDLIHEYSGGVPRKVNTVCDRLLLFGFLEELHRIDRRAVETVVDELRQEIGYAGAAAKAEPGRQDGNASHDVRISELESRVTELENALELERARLRALSLKKTKQTGQ